ncbi:MAG: hypothetical protein GF308_01855 [Candidatus Heimdallarchaeota archaeon]|nr:hypothetical protein [Candidatus Heimdallarchaeota archaeon]
MFKNVNKVFLDKRNFEKRIDMSNEKSKDEEKSTFESSFVTGAMMVALLIMGGIFLLFIQRVFGSVVAKEVLMYMGIGVGGGIIITLAILVTFRKKIGRGRYVLLGLTAGILVLSMVLSLILKSIYDDLWLFIDINSFGLGAATGTAILYIILIMLGSSLVHGSQRDQLTEGKTRKEEELSETIKKEFTEEKEQEEQEERI